MDEQQKASDDYWKSKRFMSDKAIAGKLIMDGNTEVTQQDFIDTDNLAKSNLSLNNSNYWRDNFEKYGKSGATFKGCFDPAMIEEKDWTDENGEIFKKYVTRGWGNKSLIVRKNKPIAPADNTRVVQNVPNQMQVVQIPTRKEHIKQNEKGMDFTPASNPNANSDKPKQERHEESQVGLHYFVIESVASEKQINSDLLKAIIYMETTHGWYDKYFEPFELNRSIRPSNLNIQYWGDTFGTREDLKNTRKNIEAGAEMLKRIINNVRPNATIAEIATLYNDINAAQVSNYGARVERIYNEKPWIEKNRSYIEQQPKEIH